MDALRLKEQAFVRMPDEWPRWPLLPLKKRQGDIFRDEDCLGFLLADKSPRVYIGGIFELPAGGEVKKTWKETLSQFKSIEYPDFDSLLDVWEVD